jgi:hypothetical protein
VSITRFFSEDYFSARSRFLEGAQACRWQTSSLPIRAVGPRGEALSIDVAQRGCRDARVVLVLSSGTHGVEGLFGSAVQLAALERIFAEAVLPEHVGVLLIHGLNPFGFAHTRRVNEDNVDLNRNFLLEGRAFAGAPDGYRALDALLNPKTPPSLVEPFWLRAGLEVLKHGFAALKSAVAQGQYEFPDGLFFGGKQPSETQRLLREHLPALLGNPERVLHIDFHTGLGASGSYALCVDLPMESPRVRELRSELGAEYVQGFDTTGVLYEIQGGLGSWLEQRFANTLYDCVLAEFGTYHSLKVLAAMRRENRAHFYAPHGSSTRRAAKARLLEVFCPASAAWRTKVLNEGLHIVQRALAACA